MSARLVVVGAIATGLLAAAPASADVLVNVPDQHPACGSSIKTGVWYQSFSGGPRDATIEILSARKLVLWSKHTRATTTWRFWYFHARCGHTYYVRYSGRGWGPKPYTVRVRVGSAG